MTHLYQRITWPIFNKIFENSNAMLFLESILRVLRRQNFKFYLKLPFKDTTVPSLNVKEGEENF